ncbi:thioesterase [Planctomycetota bacterium]|nr:thioesterase [Planctomycetota bacterium]
MHRIRVRYAETDQMGIAHHSAFVVWLEEARIEWLRRNGSSYRDLEAGGVLLPVVELTLRYRASLRFDDQAVITSRTERLGPSRLAFHSRIERDGALCAEGTVVVAATDRGGRPIRLPPSIISAL